MHCYSLRIGWFSLSIQIQGELEQTWTSMLELVKPANWIRSTGCLAYSRTQNIANNIGLWTKFSMEDLQVVCLQCKAGELYHHFIGHSESIFHFNLLVGSNEHIMNHAAVLSLNKMTRTILVNVEVFNNCYKCCQKLNSTDKNPSHMFLST